MNIQEALGIGKQRLKNQNIASAELDAEVLLIKSLNKDINRAWLYSNTDQKLSANVFDKYIHLIKCREKHEPVAYIIKQREFYGLNFYVDPNVLIPRPETELLVEEVLKEITKSYKLQAKTYTIADIGAGSGCIGISIATRCKTENAKCKIYAIDISLQALKIAKKNAKKHNVDKQINFLEGNLLEPLTEKVDFIIANLPYISEKEMKKIPADVIKFEPYKALYAGKDGLDYFREFFSQMDKSLAPHGKIFLEIGSDQAEPIAQLIKENLPKAKFKIIKDYAGKNRIIKIRT